jgi:AraC family transcriptional regulator
MSIRSGITMVVEATAQLPVATLQLVRLDIDGCAEHVRPGSDTYRLDLSITPRAQGAQACYRERWAKTRFEHVGNICVMPPGEPVAARTGGACSQTSLVCLLKPDALQDWFEGELHWTNHHLEEGLDIRDSRIQGALQRLAAEVREPGLASQILLGSVVSQLAVDLGRYCTTIAAVQPKGGLAGWRLRLIDDRLHEPQAPPSLQELAEICNISVRALTQGFRQSKGISIGEHVTGSQIEHAKRLLGAGNSVKAVAYTLGYSSSASFCYSFKRSAGETPGQYLAHVGRKHAVITLQAVQRRRASA